MLLSPDFIKQFADEYTTIYKRDDWYGNMAFLKDKLILAHQMGRNEVLNELAHDQQKLLDGFAHPKECGGCDLS